MGYSTTYTITRVDGDSRKFRNAFGEYTTKNSDGVYWFGIQAEHNSKWYDHDKQIVSAMETSGVAAVDLHGEGEEQGDVWDKEYRRVAGGQVTVRKFKYRLVREEQAT